MSLAAVETPEQAARRLAGGAIAKGFMPDALHEYRDAEGNPTHWRIRLKHPGTGAKWLRPMCRMGQDFDLGEPPTPKKGKPLYRLDRIMANPSATVWVVEGEGCADALERLGKVACTSGGANSADAADWSPLRGRRVTLWPDHDKPGAGYADAVARHLRALGCEVDRVDVEQLGLPEKGDVVDWLRDHDAAELDHLPMLSWVETSAPEPLRRPIPASEPYPLEELGSILAPAAHAVRRVIQAPGAICGASMLAAASLAVQHLADVIMDGRRYPLSLWLLSVAESGERKSAVDGEAMRPAREHERLLAAEYQEALGEHLAETEEWNARRDAAKVKAKQRQGEGLGEALRNIGDAPPAPLLPKVIVADFTSEGLAKMLAIGRPSVGAFTDEAALVFGGHGMTKETVMRTAGTLCKLWDRGELDRIRAADGAVKLYGRRLALHLMAQPVIAERALSDDVLKGQGFLARCLLAWPESTAGRRPYVPESLADDPALVRYRGRLGELFRRPLPLAEGQRQEIAPPLLRLSDDACAIWRQLHDMVEQEMGPGGRFAMVRPWASKTPEQALRIAGVLHLIDQPDALHIDAPTVERAAELALWHLNEAARLAGTAELSCETRDAEALLVWCHETARRYLHSGDALRLGPARIRDRERFAQAMDELERAGWAERIPEGMVLEGRRRRNVWRIVPSSEGS